MTEIQIETRRDLIDHVKTAVETRSSEFVLAMLRAVPAELIERLLHSEMVNMVSPPIGSGIGASPGAASGEIVTSAALAMQRADEGRSVILVRPLTTPDDVLGMQASAGIVTMHGGMSSHAAVVARGWGIPAVVGSSEVEVIGSTVVIGGTEFSEGDVISIDGRTGAIYAGTAETDDDTAPTELWTLLEWADRVTELVGSQPKTVIRANADTANDAQRAIAHGATGIGLCRTEHMFLADDRLPIMRAFILSEDPVAQEQLLGKLEAAQETDFVELLEVMGTRPVTVRLLDPPLHEFLPSADELLASKGAGTLDTDGETQLDAVLKLREVNPMLGTRGVRLGAVRPGLYEAQVRSLVRAMRTVAEREIHSHVEIMIPLVTDPAEFRMAQQWVREAISEVDPDGSLGGAISIGAMIETPRAALLAGQIARDAEFISFGTNDLTQMTFGLSRDDVEVHLLPRYEGLGVLEHNPFKTLDVHGVGRLVAQAIADAIAQRPSIKIGVCGEHAGDPQSIEFLVGAGCTSLSCSPFRVPVARLVSAQTALSIDNDAFRGAEILFTFPPLNQSGSVHHDIGDPGDPASLNEIDVLRVLRLRGFSTLVGLTQSLGVNPSELLNGLVANEEATYIEAREMYMLSPMGRSRIDDHISATEAVTALGGPYELFLELNIEFKHVCTDWQVRDGEPNAHDDVGYDQECIERLATLFAAAEPILTEMSETVPRIDMYRRRLNEALDAVTGGSMNRFTGVMSESFHDIWMELHEDLISMQKIDRASEGSF